MTLMQAVLLVQEIVSEVERCRREHATGDEPVKVTLGKGYTEALGLLVKHLYPQAEAEMAARCGVELRPSDWLTR